MLGFQRNGHQRIEMFELFRHSSRYWDVDGEFSNFVIEICAILN